MTRFLHDQDRRAYDAAVTTSPAHHMIGDLRSCQFEARVDFAGGVNGCVGAIVTENPGGAVRVTYFRSVRTLKAAWIDAVHSHADCCLDVAAA